MAGYESIRKLIDPEPMEYLGRLAAAAIIGNEAVALLQIRTGRQIGSAALVADGRHARIIGFTLLAALADHIGPFGDAMITVGPANALSQPTP